MPGPILLVAQRKNLLGLYLLGGTLPTIPHSQKTHPGSAVWAAEFLSWVRLAHMSEILPCLSLEETGHKLNQSLDLLSSNTLLILRQPHFELLTENEVTSEAVLLH